MAADIPNLEFLSDLLQQLGRHWKQIEPAHHTPDLYVRAEPATAAGEPRFWLTLADQALTQALIRPTAIRVLAQRISRTMLEQDRHHAFVHAASLSWRNRTLLLVGRSRTGKSTMAAALVQDGAVCMNDDITAIDDGGFIQPLYRPIQLRPDMAPRYQPPHPSQLEGPGSGSTASPQTPDHILFMQYDPDGSFALSPMSAGEAVQIMMANSLNARNNPEPALKSCAAVATAAQCWHGTRGDAATMLAPLKILL